MVENSPLGRPDQAKAALAKALELRPGSTVQNISLRTRNVSPVYIEGRNRFDRTLVEIGLPER